MPRKSSNAISLHAIILASNLIVPSLSSNLGVSFSPAGLLTPYHLGVAYQLSSMNFITKETSLAGSSGGALAAATSALDIDPMVSLKACCDIAEQCLELGTWGTLQQALDEKLTYILPENSAELILSRPGQTRIAYTEVFPKFKSRIISEFTSKKDLIQVLHASCNIPFYYSGYPAVRLRNFAYGI